jgi:Fic family protein
MSNNISTGQLSPSKIEGCPVFTPIKISDQILGGLRANDNVKLKPLSFDSGFLKLYLLKFLAGDKNTSSGFADCAIDELYLWDVVRVGSNRFVKNVCSAVSRFDQALVDLNHSSKLTLDELTKINTSLRPKKRNYGVRKSDMRAGNPKTNPNAFYCIPPELVVDYMQDYLKFYNNDTDTLDKALFALLQFIFIHPFRDGNGRLSRLLLINIVQKKHGIVFSSLLAVYLKNIDKKEFHNCMKHYREGDILPLKQYHEKAINWTHKSYNELCSLLSNYEKMIGRKNLDSNECYRQIIIKTPIKSTQELDSRIFHEHGKKAGNSIYINTALLNALNQFDYYLRFELRTCMIAYSN